MLVLSVMSIFLVVTAPLWYLLIVSLYKLPSQGWRGLLSPWFGGLIIGMAALLITLGLLSRVPFGMNFNQLYFWAWLRGTGWPMIPGVLIVTSMYLSKPTSLSRIRNVTGWFSGIAVIYMLWTALVLDPGFDAYRIFFIPMVWIAVLGCTAFLVDRGLRLSHRSRYIFLILAFIAPSLITLAPVLYIYGEKIVAWIIVLMVTAGSAIFILLDSRG